MKHAAFVLSAVLIGILLSGCMGKYPSLADLANTSLNLPNMTNASNVSQIYQNASNAVSNVISSIANVTANISAGLPVNTPPNASANASVNVSTNVSTTNVSNASKPSVETMQLEEYNGGFFTIKKPTGWDVYTAGSCATFSFIMRNKSNPAEQIFYYGEVGPVYLAEEQKQLDRGYMNMGGYPIAWYEMPVVNPLTPENFLQSFHLITDTNISKRFMPQSPRLENVDIISSVPSQSPISGETKTMRALFMQDGKLSEGMFYVTVAPLIPLSGYAGGGIGYAFSFMGISTGKDEFKGKEEKLTESIGSLSLSQEYVGSCIQQQDQQAQSVMRIGETLSETSDIIMNSWENRNRVDDILSEKRSDAILSRDRVYNPDTGEVYYVENGFYDGYDINRERYVMDNLQQLPGNDWDLWTAPTSPGTEIR